MKHFGVISLALSIWTLSCYTCSLVLVIAHVLLGFGSKRSLVRIQSPRPIQIFEITKTYSVKFQRFRCRKVLENVSFCSLQPISIWTLSVTLNFIASEEIKAWMTLATATSAKNQQPGGNYGTKISLSTRY
jgi:hypothetical protein